MAEVAAEDADGPTGVVEAVAEVVVEVVVEDAAGPTGAAEVAAEDVVGDAAEAVTEADHRGPLRDPGTNRSNSPLA